MGGRNIRLRAFLFVLLAFLLASNLYYKGHSKDGTSMFKVSVARAVKRETVTLCVEA